MDSFAPTELTRTRRRADRGRYDRKTVYAILDEGLLGHVGYALGDQPVVTPTLYWRHGDSLYWHGSAASRMLATIAAGVKACLAVSLLDGLVVARSAFHMSVNYRSVMAFGTARPVTEHVAKLAALEGLVERLYPGRWRAMRPVTEQELKATTVLEMPIEEVSAKIRSGPPIDDEEDYAARIWAGVIPLATVAGAPVPDPRLDPAIAAPPDFARYALAPDQSRAPGG